MELHWTYVRKVYGPSGGTSNFTYNYVRSEKLENNYLLFELYSQIMKFVISSSQIIGEMQKL